MFSRCYPTLSDMIFDLTDWDIPLPIFSYGFCVALGFLAAAYTLMLELKRKEKLGQVSAFQREVIVGETAKPFELLINAFLGFLLGFKLLWVIFNWAEFAANPQQTLLSTEGSWIGGLIGAALLAYLKYYEKKKEQLEKPKKVVETIHPYQTVGDLTIVAAISGIIGAKLFYFFESPGNFRDFLQDPFGSFFGGLTVYGGMILGAICVMWYTKKKGMNPIHIADAATPGLFLAYAFGRQGCQISGDGDWGIVNTLNKPSWLSWLPDRLWAFTYPHNINNEGIPIPGCEEVHCYVLPDAVFPTPIYESLVMVLVFLLLWSLRKRITIPGVMFSLYFVFAGIERYFIEKIRVNTVLDILGVKMTQAEFISVLYVLAGIVGVVYFVRKQRSTS